MFKFINKLFNDFADDVLGLDPNGKGIYQSFIFKPVDDLLGIDPNNNGIFTFLRSKGLNVDFSDFNALVTQAVKAQMLKIASTQSTMTFDINGVKYHFDLDLLAGKITQSNSSKSVGKGKIHVGGQGATLYIIDSLYDVVVETSTAPNEIDTVVTNVHFTLPQYVENLTLTNHKEPINGNGNQHDNVLIGSNSKNIMYAYDGDDTINGLAGDDVLYGGAGNDVIIDGDGNDTLVGGTGNDIFVLHSSADVVIEYSNQGHDTIRALATVRLPGNVEDLVMIGSGSINGYGNDLFNVMSGNDAANFIYGGGGNDSIFALGGHDYLFGESGNDQIHGGNGTDWLVGGSGSDDLIGGQGVDRFGYNGFWESNLAQGNDYIGFFSVVEGDRIQLPQKPNSLFNVGSVSGTSLQNAISSMYKDVNRSVSGVQPLKTNEGAVFSYGTRTYLTVNDGVQAFNPSSDLLIDITGHSGLGSSAFSIPVSSVFV